MNDILLYDSLSNQKKTFEPIDINNIRIYACGPTVYNFAHIGNARMAIVFDSFVRLFRAKYTNVTYVSNITDIDDKIIEAANELDVSIDELTQKYTKIYNEDMSKLNVLPPDVQPKATEYVKEMVDFIQQLIEGGKAYEKDGHVFFHVPEHAAYGKLSNRAFDQQLAGSRVQVSNIKKNQQDFVLWKPSNNNQPGWNSPWGFGRPGWHTECCVMSEVNLQIPFDIHGGGQDLIFPHHENEIAQTCANNNSENPEDYARYWIHNGFVTVDGEKMSKSLNNIILINDILGNYHGEVIRLALLSTHYRKSLDWNEHLLYQSKNFLDKGYNFLKNNSDIEVLEESKLQHELSTILCNDLNIPEAITFLNKVLKTTAKFSLEEIKTVVIFAGEVLGLFHDNPDSWFQKESKISLSEKNRIENLIKQRNIFKAQKDFEAADVIRAELKQAGIILEDTSEGTTWKVENS